MVPFVGASVQICYFKHELKFNAPNTFRTSKLKLRIQ